MHTEATTATTIEPAASQDLDAILALLEANGLPAEGLFEHLHTALVAREHDAVVGCAALEVYPDGALLRSVAVDAAYRGRGLGVRLTEAALELARTRGIADIYLLTETAGEYFPRLGFRPITRADVPPGVQQSVEFTTACAESALVLTRHLEPK